MSSAPAIAEVTPHSEPEDGECSASRDEQLRDEQLPGEASPLDRSQSDRSQSARWSRGLVRQHSLAALRGRIINALAMVGSILVLARVLDPYDFSRFQSLRVAWTLAGLTAILGLGSVSLRNLGRLQAQEAPSRAGPTLRTSLRLSLFTQPAAAVVALVVTYYLGGRFFGEYRNLGFSVLMAAGVLAFATMQYSGEVARGLGRLDWANLIGGVRGAPLINLVLLLGAVALWLVGAASFTSMVWLFTLGAAAAALGGGWVVLRALRQPDQPGATPPQVVETSAPAMMRGAWMMGAGAILTFAAVQFDFLLAPAFLGDDEATAYINARRLVLLFMFPLALVNSTAEGLIAPLFAGGQTRRLERALRVGTTCVLLPCLAVAAGSLLLPQLFVRILLGPGYEAAAPLYCILLPGHLLLVASGACGLVLQMTGRERWALTTAAIAAAVLLIGGPWVMKGYGATGLAWLTSAVVGLQNLANVLLAKRLVGVNCWADPTLMLRPWRLVEGWRSMQAAKKEARAARRESDAAHAASGVLPVGNAPEQSPDSPPASAASLGAAALPPRTGDS